MKFFLVNKEDFKVYITTNTQKGLFQYNKSPLKCHACCSKYDWNILIYNFIFFYLKMETGKEAKYI